MFFTITSYSHKTQRVIIQECHHKLKGALKSRSSNVKDHFNIHSVHIHSGANLAQFQSPNGGLLSLKQRACLLCFLWR